MAPIPQLFMTLLSSSVMIARSSEKRSVPSQSEGEVSDSTPDIVLMGFLIFLGCIVCGPLLWIALRLFSKHGAPLLRKLWENVQFYASWYHMRVMPRHYFHRQERRMRRGQARPRRRVWMHPRVRMHPRENPEVDIFAGSWTTVSENAEHQSIVDSPPPYTPTDEEGLPTPPTPVHDPQPPCYGSWVSRRSRQLQSDLVVGESWNPWARGI